MNTNKVKTIEASQFDTEILAHDDPIIVDFYGADCAVCDAVAQWLDSFEPADIFPVRKIFLSDPTSPLAQNYQLRGIPTLIRFENGEEIARMTNGFTIDTVQQFVGKSSD